MKIPKTKTGRINFNELSRQTGILPTTLRARYKDGVRGEELLKMRKKRNDRMIAFKVNGETVYPTEEEKTVFRRQNLNSKIVQERLDNGWDYELAISLSKINYTTLNDEIVFQMQIQGNTYSIPYDEYLDLCEEGITGKKIRLWIDNGKDLYSLVPEGTLVYINGVLHEKANLINAYYDEYQRQARARNRQKERERLKKPWLYEVPQVHGRSKYCQYLMETSIFPKAVR